MITSKENEKLKLIRKLHERRHRERERLFLAEGEDLIAAAEAAGWEPLFVLRAGEDVERELLGAVSALGSGARVISVYPIRYRLASEGFCVYLHGVGDPANVGAIIRSAHALIGGMLMLGPDCADPFSPKAVRASMGSIFALPVYRGDLGLAARPRVALLAHGGAPPDEHDVRTLCLGSEREGLPQDVIGRCDRTWTIPLREDGAESLNVAAAAAIALGRIASAGSSS